MTTDLVMIAPTFWLVLMRGALTGATLMFIVCLLGFGYGLLYNSYWLVPLASFLSAVSCVLYAALIPHWVHPRPVLKVLTAFATTFVLIVIGSLICGPLYYLATSPTPLSMNVEELAYPLVYAAVFAPFFTPVLLFSTRLCCVGRGFPVHVKEKQDSA